MKYNLQICRFSILKTFTAEFFVTIAVLFIAQQAFAQFSDDFTDSDLTGSPFWSNVSSNFVVASQQLKLQAPASPGNAFITTSSRAIDMASWEFFVRLEFNPSTANNVRIYLTSDRDELSGPLNGYFVLIGSADRDISMYRQSGSTITKFIDGENGKSDLPAISVRIKATRDTTGIWTLYSDVGNTGIFIPEGSAVDLTHTSSNYFGMSCTYTSTRSDEFYFDDFIVSGRFTNDTLPTGLVAQYKDVILTEVMVDPTPAVALPEAEFVELFNRSKDPFNLKDWQLSDGEGEPMKLPDFILLPGAYAILNASEDDYTGQVLHDDHFPSLNNSEGHLTLKNNDGLTIDSILYSSDWYGDEMKKNGGWSLELIDPDNTCGEMDNWRASTDPTGGSPGKENSIFASKPDLSGPRAVALIPLSPTILLLRMNEKLSGALPELSSFAIEPAMAISSVHFSDVGLRSITLNLSANLEADVTYTITANAIYDCTGNVIDPEYNQISFGLLETAVEGDVVINEILFNPRPGGTDFVEIVNTSTNYINLRDWKIGNIDQEMLINSTRISLGDFVLPPGAYLIITERADLLMAEYPFSEENNVLQVDQLPSFNDDDGSVGLANQEGVLIDHFRYTKDMHSVFMKDPEGVSLERISFGSSSSDADNWKSASAGSGYATPGYLNSNAAGDPVSDEMIWVEPEVLIPLTGQPDFVRIQYAFDQGGYVAHVNVRDEQGRIIKTLAENELLGTTGYWRWDGDRDDGRVARLGYYMVWVDVYDARGFVKTFKKRIAVSARF